MYTSKLVMAALAAASLGLTTAAEAGNDIQVRVKKVLCIAPSGPFPGDTMKFVGAAIHGDPEGRVPGPINGMQAPMEYGVPMLSMLGPKGKAAAVGMSIGFEGIKQAYDFAKFFDENRVPDDLYIKVNGQKVWPRGRESQKIRAGQELQINAVGPAAVGGQHSVELWERDTGLLEGDDDLLGDVRFGAGGGEGRTVTFSLSNKSEGSVYLVELELFRPPPPPVYVKPLGTASKSNDRTKMCSFKSNLRGASPIARQRSNDLVADLPSVAITSQKGGFDDVRGAGLTEHEAKSWEGTMAQLRPAASSKVSQSGIAWTWDVPAQGITFGRQDVIVPYSTQKHVDTNGNARGLRWIHAAPQSASDTYLQLPLEGEFSGDPNPISMEKLKPWLDCMSPEKLRQAKPVLRQMRAMGYLVDTEADVAKVTRGLKISERIQLGRSVDNIRAAITEGGFQPTSRDLNAAIGAGADDKAVVSLLLELGARPDANTMMKAVEQGDGELIGLLANKGARITDRHVDKAISMGDPAVVDLVFQKGGGNIVGLEWTDVKSALDKGDTKLALQVVNAGAKTNPTTLRQALLTRDRPLIAAVAEATPPSSEALALAMESGDAQMFRRFAQRGARLKDSQPVYRALSTGNREMAALGLKHGGDANEVLSYAMRRRSGLGIGVALEAGADPDPVLRWAIERQDVGLFQDLLSVHRADAQRALGTAMAMNSEPFAELAITQGKANPTTALAGQVQAGNRPWIAFLIDGGADASAGVSTAIDAGNAEVLAYLVELEADASGDQHVRRAAELGDMAVLQVVVETAGGSPDAGLPAAVEKDDLKVAGYLLEQGAKPAGLNVPAARGKLPMVQLLVEAGASPTAGIEQAVVNKRDAVAVYLLDQGASTRGMLPIAAKTGRLAICRKLVEKGAKPDEGMPKAVEFGQLEVATFLIAQGADVSGHRLIGIGVAEGHASVVGLLASKGAAAKHIDDEGDTFLHEAARQSGKADLVAVLLDAGVDVNARNASDDTALLDAVRVGNANVAVVERLVAAGADVNAVGAKGRIVLKEAKGAKVKKVLKAAGATKK